ncbi:MAG: nicotinate-nucleotide adenylyltransferase [Actinomycetota bacterium]
MRIGLMGGTFDPIHHGHLVAAEHVAWASTLDQVLFVPAGKPWQKGERDVTPGSDRLAMTERAVADNERFSVSRIDLDRPGPTYTIDTLRAVREERPDAELFFVTGADAILEILTWKDPHEVLDLATFVAVTRPGYDISRIADLNLPIDVTVVEIPALSISSSDIRRRVREGRPIRYLVPDEVRAYITEHGLYRRMSRESGE